MTAWSCRTPEVARVFRTMRGKRLLRFDLARRVSCIAPDRLAVILRLDAAAVTGTVLIAAGQDAAQQRKDPPAWVKSENDRDRWEHSFDERDKLLRKLADQARAALSADQPEEDPKSEGEETNDNAAA